jgi:two-component system chemotaxis sensor kinase CheA
VLYVGEVLKATRGAAALGELPAVSPPAGPDDPDGLPAPARTVLVVEDSPIVRDLIVESLRAHGLRVLEAPDGQDALEQLEQHADIDLLVTDVEMPRLDGLGLIARMRARGGRRIPAIVVSTRGSNADKLAAVQVGADAYLVKSDFSRETLWTMVSRFLG